MFSVCYYTMKELLVYQIIHHSGHVTLFEGLVLKCDKGMHSGRRTCFLEGEAGQWTWCYQGKTPSLGERVRT